jgi:hypothetical protein
VRRCARARSAIWAFRPASASTRWRAAESAAPDRSD